MRSALPFATAAMLLTVTSVARAEEPRFPKRDSAAAPQIDCTCRYRGEDILLGQAVCMGGRLARCEMVLNNTSWSFTKEACPIASLAVPAASRARPTAAN